MASAQLSSVKQRKKVLTYGKRASPALRRENLTFFDQDELSLDHTPAKRRKITPPELAEEPVRALDPPALAQRSKLKAPMAKRSKPDDKDTFDVPSSDDEAVAVPISTFPNTRVRFRSNLVDDEALMSTKSLTQIPHRSQKLDTDTTQTVQSESQQDRSLHGATADAYRSQAGLGALDRLKLRKGLSLQGSTPTSASQTSQRSRQSSTISRSSSNGALRLPQRNRSTSQSGNERILSEPTTTELGFDGASSQTRKTPSKVSNGKLSRSRPQHERPSTPERTEPSDTARTTRLNLTPKQSRLWQGLLKHSDRQSQSVQSGIGDESRRNGIGKRLRMSDRLRGAVESSRHVNQEDSASESESADDRSPVRATETISPERAAPAVVNLRRNDRLTYSQQRSHLLADDLGDHLLLADASLDSPKKLARQISRPPDEFDLESDNEDKSGQVRSIHELRVVGQSTRLAAATDDMLSDITNRSDAMRSRRRLALVRLASQLLNESAAKRLVQDGHLKTVAAELQRGNDLVSSTILASILLSAELADAGDHVLEQVRSCLPQLLDLTDNREDIQTLIADRSERSSLAFRKEAASYFEQILDRKSIWLENVPTALTPCFIALRSMEELARQLRQVGDGTSILNTSSLERLVRLLTTAEDTNEDYQITQSLVISIMELLSIYDASAAWSPAVVTAIAKLLRSLTTEDAHSQHLQFLTYRLCLNITNNAATDHFVFAKYGAVQRLLEVITSVFDLMLQAGDYDMQQRVVDLDLLVLAIGIMINLTEHSQAVRKATLSKDVQPLLMRTIAIFRARHETAQDVDSEDESASNVAYGYLAVLLANLCHDTQVRQRIASELPGKNLKAVTEAVEEFVLHHQRVDSMHFDGDEGQQVWSSFTARLEEVLMKLRSAVDA